MCILQPVNTSKIRRTLDFESQDAKDEEMGVDETQVLPKSENATQDPYASQPPRDNGIKEPRTGV